ncbi:MAG: hypothetical protein ACTHKH_19615, partial [Trinickia sp.]
MEFEISGNHTEQSRRMAKLKRVRTVCGFSAAALTLLLAVTPAVAQSKVKATAPTAATAAAPSTGLQARVETLEEQLIDMQV